MKKTASTRTKAPSLGARVRERREALGMKQYELAHLVGWSPAAVSHLEHDRMGPSRDKLQPLAKALKCSLAYLLNGT